MVSEGLAARHRLRLCTLHRRPRTAHCLRTFYLSLVRMLHSRGWFVSMCTCTRPTRSSSFHLLSHGRARLSSLRVWTSPCQSTSAPGPSPAPEQRNTIDNFILSTSVITIQCDDDMYSAHERVDYEYVPQLVMQPGARGWETIENRGCGASGTHPGRCCVVHDRADHGKEGDQVGHQAEQAALGFHLRSARLSCSDCPVETLQPTSRA